MSHLIIQLSDLPKIIIAEKLFVIFVAECISETLDVCCNIETARAHATEFSSGDFINLFYLAGEDTNRHTISYSVYPCLG